MSLHHLRSFVFILGLIAPVLAGPAADARSLTEEETSSLDGAVSSYLRAVGRGDAEKIVAALPPRVLAVFGAASGIEAKKLNKTLVEQTAALMSKTKFTNVAASGEVPEAGDAKLADGTDVVWAILKTSFVTESADESTQNWQPLLALQEGEEWYFLRVEGPQSKQLAAIAYPFLNDIDFPSAASAPIN